MTKIPLIYNQTKQRRQLIRYYVDIFQDVPSMAHLVKAFTHMEALIMERYSEAKIAPQESLLNKFEKCKKLALNNANLNERKVAFNMAVKLFEKIAEITLIEPEDSKQ